MTPILKGTAARLGLRKPPATLAYEVTVNTSELSAAFEAFSRHMALLSRTPAFPLGAWLTLNRP